MWRLVQLCKKNLELDYYDIVNHNLLKHTVLDYNKI